MPNILQPQALPASIPTLATLTPQIICIDINCHHNSLKIVVIHWSLVLNLLRLVVFHRVHLQQSLVVSQDSLRG